MSSQLKLMLWRNFIIKRRKVDEIIKGWILPLLVFMALWLLYLEFPNVIGTMKTVEEKVRTFEDDNLYNNVNDDLFGDDDYLYTKIQRKVLDLSLNSYLEQVGVPIAFLQLQWSLITLIVTERENRVKEMMLLMGLKEIAYWVSMFLTELFTSSVLCLLLSYVSTIWGLFHEGSFLGIFALLGLYSLASISFLYFVSTFFKSAQSAAQLTSTALILSIIAFFAGGMDGLSVEMQLLCSGLPSIAIQYGILAFFPANSEIGMPVCVDECPDTHTYCKHSVGCAGDSFHGHRAISKRDFCDIDSDCCGDWFCDKGSLDPETTPCVIHIHQINCLSQEEFDKKTLPFNLVCLALLVDFILYTLLTALFVSNSWDMDSVVVKLSHCVMDARQWCANLTKPKYQRVLSDESIDTSAVLIDAAGSDDDDYVQEYDDVEGVDDLGLSCSPDRFYPVGFVEDRPMAQHAAVQVVGLTKTFQRRGFGSKNKREYALNRCCLEMREGELTVLMGQNGAGKTTLISCLTGSLKANSGRASVLGYNALDVRGVQKLRQSIGVCPQEDAVFEGFTPREMLLFYARLKGVEEMECESQVEAMLSEMGLMELNTTEEEEKHQGKPMSNQSRKAADMCVEELSGGQRRRVSIGIALIGDSKFVVLDEPTSAMDPVGKHQVWTLLRRMRAGRTILLTTHLMDEADACADRVAVMAKGQIHCAGSPAFLKRNVGAGYSLTLAKQQTTYADNKGKETSTETNSPKLAEVSDWVKSYLSSNNEVDSSLESKRSSSATHQSISSVRSDDSLVMTLPFSVNASAFFRELDQHLKKQEMQESIVYGVEMPSLESVFLTITEKALELNNHTSATSDSSCKVDGAVIQTTQKKKSQFDDLGIEDSDWQRFFRQTKAVARFRLHIMFIGRSMSTLGLVLPSSLAFGGSALVLGKMHTLGTEGKCALIASMLLSCIFIPGFLASELLLEREKGLRHLLTVSGCGVNSFWFGTWIADLISSQLPPILTLWAMSYICEVEAWVWHPAFYISSLLFMLHQTLLGSIISFTFRSSSSASLFSPGMILVTTILVPSLLVLGFIKMVPPEVTADFPFEKGGTLLYIVATCSPHMLFWSVLMTMESPIDTDPAPSIPIFLSMQLAGCLFLVSCVLLFDASQTSPIRPTGRSSPPSKRSSSVASPLSQGLEEEDDEDVKREMKRAEQDGDLSHFLRLVKLRKEYRDREGQPVVAVKSISLVVSQGECVGLLGPNGAGKSTTISMLSRAAVPTEGEATICGESVLSNAPQALRNLGLVPQDMNTLWGFASIDAHLRLFANLRPCHSNTSSISEELTIVEILESMDLSQHRHKCASALSGGMKRRLSTAIGLIGSPKVVVLDEPTAGLDPLSRRHVWRALLRAMSTDRLALLLTTHSLEESEVLCHRLGIVVKGALKCLGTPIHLKTKFGRGYEITVLLGTEENKQIDNSASDDRGDTILPLVNSLESTSSSSSGGGGHRISDAVAKISEQFTSCSVLERSDNRCRLLVSKSDMDLPKAFSLLEDICSEADNSKSSSKINCARNSFYCVNLSSIEQVFLDVVEGEESPTSNG